MAVAVDLGDPNSPWKSVHPRDKQGVGYSLALGGRAVACKKESLYYTGPIASVAYGNSSHSIIVHCIHVMDNTLEIRPHSGFEVYCMKTGQLTSSMLVILSLLNIPVMLVIHPLMSATAGEKTHMLSRSVLSIVDY